MIEPAIGLIAGHNQRRSDEIRRLAAQLDEAQRLYRLLNSDYDDCLRERHEARAELAKAQGKLGTLAAEYMAQRMENHTLRAALKEIFNVGPLGVDTYAACWKRMHAIADEALHGPAAAQVSAYKAAVPFGEMGQIATPHDGGQAASGHAEPTHCQHGVSDQNNCAQCDKLRAEGGVK